MDFRRTPLAPTGPTLERAGVGVVLSVVVPMYKEAARIEETLDDLVATLAAGAYLSEIILVDDGSPDATAAVVQPWLSEIPQGAVGNLGRVVLVRHAVNRGKGAAVRTGLAAAAGQWVLMMDADNAARVREVARLWPLTPHRPAMVCGSRNTSDARVASRASRRFFGRIFRLALGVLRLNLLRDTQCGFKLYRADVARAVVRLGREDGFAFDLEHLLIASRMGPIAEVGIAWEHKGGGTVNPVLDGLRMLRDAARIRWRFMTERGLDHGEPATAPSPGLSGAVIVVKPQAASAPIQS
ncbi:MAG: glycosyltransferase [bacterium]